MNWCQQTAKATKEFGLHTFVLCKKNFYEFRARKLSTAMLLFVPSIFVYILWFFARISSTTENSLFPNPVYASDLPRCEPWNGSPCFDIMISGNGSEIDRFEARILQRTSTPSSKYKRFQNYDEMRRYLIDHPNSTHVAISFPVNSYLNYALLYNTTDFVQVRGEITYRYMSHLLTYQTAVDSTILDLEGACTSLRVGSKPYPSLGGLSDPETTASTAWGPMLMYLTGAYPFLMFLVRIVNEKQTRLRIGLAMMGMQQSSYWAHWFVTIISFEFIISVFVYVTVQICRLDVLAYCNFGAFLLWEMSLHLYFTGLLIIFAAMFQTTKGATTAGFAYIVVGFMVTIIFSGGNFELVYWIYGGDSTASVVLKNLFNWVLPYMHYTKVFADFSTKTLPISTPDGMVKGPGFATGDFYKTPVPRWSFTLAEGAIPTPMHSIGWLLIIWVVYSAIGVYLDSIWKAETGLQRSPWFFLTPSFWGIHCSRGVVSAPTEQFYSSLDDDVVSHVRGIFAESDDATHALKAKMLRKEYFNALHTSRVCAVEGLSFTIDKGELLGVLGHNGAGKTTTISMLVGLHTPSSGDALINGVTIYNSDSRAQVGVCPQHDILWGDLNPEEHLTIFADMKGLSRDVRNKEIDRLLNQVGLEYVRHKPVKAFSGGMKRRLSVSIANIGSPTVIFLDEPTTGMDPHSRRQVWQLIQTLKQNAAVLLTTHSMEEADALADRIAVMAKGQMRCLGSPLHIKNKFGSGYQIKAVCDIANTQRMIDWFVKNIPEARPNSNNAGSFIYQLATEHTPMVPLIIGKLDAVARENGSFMKEWGLSQTTLEEVYLEINQKFHIYENVAQGNVVAPSVDANPQSSQGAIQIQQAPNPHAAPSSPTAETDPEKTQIIGKQYISATGSPPPKSREYSALFRKNLSFNKRQPFAVCCLVAFPIFVVVLCAIVRVLLNLAVSTSSGDTITEAPPMRFSTTPSILSRYSYVAGLGLTDYNFMLSGAAASKFGKGGRAAPDFSDSPMMEDFLSVILNKTRPVKAAVGSDWYPYFDTLPSSRSVDETIGNILRNLQTEFSRTKEARASSGVGGVEKFDARDRVSGNPSWLTDPAFAGYLRVIKSFPMASLEIQKLAIGGSTVPSCGVNLDVSYVAQLNSETDDSIPYISTLVSQDRVALMRGALINAMNNAILRNLTGDRNKTIIAGQTIIPYGNAKSRFSPDGIIDNMIFFFLPLLLIVPLGFFTYHIVYEKENRLRELAKINAMTMTRYWMLEIMYDFLLYMAIMLILFLSFAAIQNRWITQTSPGFIVLLFVGTALNTCAWGILLSAFIQQSTMAMIVGVLVTLGLWLGGELSEFLVWQGDTPPFIQMIFPHLAMIHGMYSTFQRCLNLRCVKNEEAFASHTFYVSLLYIWLTLPFWTALAFYLDNVLPSKWGLRKHPLFPIRWIWGKIKKSQKVHTDHTLTKTGDTGEDEDVLKLRTEVEQGSHDTDPLLIKKLRKEYKTNGSRYIAVHQLDVGIPDNHCFGLLGPNGAGKTTTISMLCGMFAPSNGTATICGYDIKDQMDLVHLNIGICPQHDISYQKHLSVEEHLLFVSRLKGIPAAYEKDHVNYWLSRVRLYDKRKRMPHQMSGGEQRRLSIAMALVGNPKVVFFDEPTTGLDPSARRLIWDIMMDAKVGRTIVLTTHSMEEAEVLSDTIGIMVLGRMRCYGSPLRLKNRYGKGFRITLSFHDEDRDRVVKEMKKLCPSASEMGVYIKGQVTLEITTEESPLVEICTLLTTKKKEIGIVDWGIAQTSMDDVFLQIIKIADTHDQKSAEEEKAIVVEPSADEIV